jgi:regulator of sirC expression with transglutaminase-like and TPR domain
MWASDRGDIDLLVESFVLSEAQRAEAEAVFLRFSDEARAKYGTAERMMALLFSSGTPAIFQPLAETPKSAEDVAVRARVWNDRGESNELELAFRRYPEGWRVVVPEWQTNKSLARLRR